MTEFRHRIAIIVPTRNRPDLLTKLLDSIRRQTVAPHQVVVVDGSDGPIDEEIRKLASPHFTYVRIFPPGLTKQRNAGIRALNDDITLAGYLDDDIVMEKGAVEAMLRFWEGCPDDVAGTSFHITNAKVAGPLVRIPGKLVGRFFWCDAFGRGRVLKSGYHTTVEPVVADTYTEWLCGGATVWRRTILEANKFDESLTRASHMDDLDFSYGVGRKHRLVVLKDAKVEHYPPPFVPTKCLALGRMNIQERYRFVRKHRELSLPLFYWGGIGEAITLALVSIPRRSSCELYKAAGVLVGLTDALRGKVIEYHGEFRRPEDKS